VTRKALLGAAILLASVSIALCGGPDGGEIARRVEEANAWLKDYTATLTVSVNMERLRVPSMKVEMYFKRPDKVHFDSKGFALLPKQLGGMNFLTIRDKFEIDPRVVSDSLDGARGMILTLMPKDDRTHLRRVQLLIDSTNWTPVRMRMPLLDGRVLTATLKHERMDQHWLPVDITLRFMLAVGDSTVPNLLEQITPSRRAQPPHDGTAHIVYSNYRVNTGLSDELFKEPEGEPKKR
jgi:hypothetical protein